jgi:hypothetical protein
MCSPGGYRSAEIIVVGVVMLHPMISPTKLAIMQAAVDAAIGMATTRNASLTVNQLAAKLAAAYEAGERDPHKLAAAVFP